MPHLTDFYEEPAALERLGQKVFLKVPLYRARQSYTPIYVNPDLYRDYIDAAEKPSWQEMSETVGMLFSVTLDPENATGEQVGHAYIDRQDDPLNIALRGNQGSGRAFYLGKHFNLKGEKTPLCTTDNPRFSDGILEMERGIWETIVSNVLFHDLDIGAPPVLAILDVHEACYAHRRDEQSHRVKIIRMDHNGALDRVTHAFFNKALPASIGLTDVAGNFGRHEGEKFTQRIIHGSWSAGNITLHGGILDFDTVCSVKGRGAQYSSSVWQCETYFGYEYKAQLKILGALAADSQINRTSESYPILEERCLTAMHAHIAVSFVNLMGFEQAESHYTAHQAALDALAEDFFELGRKFYPKFSTLAVRQGRTYSMQVFDFSVFFRLYPLLKRLERFTVDDALDRMMETALLKDALTIETREWPTSLDADYFERHALDFILEHCVTNEETLSALRDKARAFILKYDAVFQWIAADSDADLLDVEARAYVANEDRLYLYALFAPSYVLTKAKFSPKEKNDQIQFFIEANLRKPCKNHQGAYSANHYAFVEGDYSILLDGKGNHKRRVLLKKPEWRERLENARNIALEVDGITAQAETVISHNVVTIITESIPNASLLATCARDISLTIREILVIVDGIEYKLNDYLEFHYTLDFDQPGESQ